MVDDVLTSHDPRSEGSSVPRALTHTFNWVLFGATGITGRLVLEAALRRGHRPALVGRNLNALAELGRPHGLKTALFVLDDASTHAAALAGQRLIVNVAGPFHVTAEPVINAALANSIDYVDLNGEFGPLRQLLDLDSAAREHGSVLVGGAGFGVAATDGLVARLSQRLGGVDWLRLSVAADSAFHSPAVAQSMLSVLAGGGREVVNHQQRQRPIGRRRWSMRLPDGSTQTFASAPLADIVAAQHISNANRIVAGVPMPPAQAMAVSVVAPLLPLILRIPALRKQMVASSGHSASGKSRSAHASRAWVEGRKGRHQAVLLLEAGEGYAVAANLAVLAIEKMFASRPKPGAYTPASAFGGDFIGNAPGVCITEY